MHNANGFCVFLLYNMIGIYVMCFLETNVHVFAKLMWTSFFRCNGVPTLTETFGMHIDH